MFCCGCGGGAECGGLAEEGLASGGAGGRTGRAVGRADWSVTSWDLVETSSGCNKATVPVRAATWMRMEVTMHLSKGEGSAMDASESTTYRSGSGVEGEVLSLWRSVGEVEGPCPL